jgi:flagellar M-ring protein FliF
MDSQPTDLLFGLPRDFVEHLASNIGLSIIAILFLLLVLRPLVQRAVDSMAAPVGRDQADLRALVQETIENLAMSDGEAVSDLARALEAVKSERFEHFNVSGGERVTVLRVDRTTGESWTLAMPEEGEPYWAAVPIGPRADGPSDERAPGDSL